MIVPIIINEEDIFSKLAITKEQVEQAIDMTIKEITAQFAVEWTDTANKELHSTKSRYTANLRVIDEGRLKGAVLLDYSKDSFIQMIEEGATSFDMKKNFEKSSKKHTKKNGGWYLTVPFKLGTPGTLIESGFSSILPQKIYNVIEKKTINPITNRSAGLSKSEIPDQFKAPQSRNAFSNIPTSKTFEAYKHKNSIYEGAFKQKDSVTDNSYGSFRRVSDKSDANSWIYPGLEAKNLAEKALSTFETKVDIIASSAMDEALKYFGFE